MEIIIVLVAFVLFALLIMAMRNPSQTVQEPAVETVPEAPYKVETPAVDPVALVSETQPVVETTPVVELVVEEQPVKKTRKPRTPKAAPAPVVTAKKSTRGRAARSVAAKPVVEIKTRKPRSKKV
jgi:hypothetical protein